MQPTKPSSDSKPESPSESPAGYPPIAEAVDAVAPVRRRARSSYVIWVAWMAILLSLSALLGGGYSWYQNQMQANRASEAQHTRMQTVAQRLAALVATQAETEAQLKQFQTQLYAADKRLREMQVEVQVEAQVLSDAVAKLAARLSGGVDDWSVAEVERLMQIAAHRLQLAADPQSARVALRMADALLQQLAEPAFNSVRELLAAEIASLDALPAVDGFATLEALSALSAEVEALPLVATAQTWNSASEAAPPPASPPPTPTPADHTAERNPWGWRAFQDLLADLGALIEVERDDALPAALYSADLRWLTVERAQLMLEAAKLALLRAQDEAYAARLREAKAWVNDHFDTDAAPVAAWLKRVTELAESARQPELPDISASLRALRAEQSGNQTGNPSGN